MGVEKNSMIQGKHNRIYKIAMFFFVISLGLGERFAIGPIKLVYLTTAFLLLCSFLKTDRRKEKFVNRRYYELLILCAIWGSYGLFQVLWSKEITVWVASYRTLVINLIIIYLILKYIVTIEDWRFVAKSFLVLIGICLLMGFWEIHTGNHWDPIDYSKMNEVTGAYYRYKPMAFYGNINDYASILYLGLYIAFLLRMTVGRMSKYKTALFWIFVLVIVYQIVSIDSRAVLLSLLLLPLFYVYFWISNHYFYKGGYSCQKIMLGMMIGLGIFAITVIFFLHPIVYYIEAFSGAGNETSDLLRARIIWNGFIEFLDTFGLGLGPGQSIVINEINLHFFYLEVLFEYGVLMGGYILWIFFSLGYKSTLNISKSADALMRSFPFTLIVMGIASSKLISLRPMWIAFTLLYTMKYNSFGDLSGMNKMRIARDEN